MFIDKEFYFSITHSLVGYPTKSLSKIALSYDKIQEYNQGMQNPNEHLSKMAFAREALSLTRFVELVSSGYTFCNLFAYNPNRKYCTQGRWHNLIWPEYRIGKNKGAMKMQMKADLYFEGCQCIFVDIDYTRFENIEDYIAVLRLKPTVLYLSYSDNEYKIDAKQKNNLKYDPQKGIKSRRFRLCYVLNQIIYGEESFKTISSAINKMVEESTGEIVQDDCGKKMSQYFNGSMNKDVYLSGYIYDVTDFGIDTFTPPTSYNDFPKEGQPQLDNQISLETPTFKYDIKPVVLSQLLICDMERLSYDEFMCHYRHKYHYYYRKDDGVWMDGCQVICDEYFALYYNVYKLKDGQKRRKKLFERMCLRRVMFPEISPDEVFFCAYEDLNRFFDNRIDPIDISCLVRNVKSAFRLSVEEIQHKYSKDIAYLQSKKPKGGLIYKVTGAKTVAERNMRMKEIRIARFDRLYDSNLSLKENAELLHCSERTIRNYGKALGITISTKVTGKVIRQMIDINLSIRKNVDYLRTMYNIKTSKDRVSKILNALKDDMQKVNKTFKDADGWYTFKLKEDRSVFKDYYPICITSEINKEFISVLEYCKHLIVV